MSDSECCWERALGMGTWRLWGKGYTTAGAYRFGFSAILSAFAFCLECLTCRVLFFVCCTVLTASLFASLLVLLLLLVQCDWLSLFYSVPILRVKSNYNNIPSPWKWGTHRIFLGYDRFETLRPLGRPAWRQRFSSRYSS